MLTSLKTALAALAMAIFPCLSWAAGEVISFNINNTTANDEVSGLLSEPALCVANKHWNMLFCEVQGARPNNVSVTGAKDNSGTLTSLSLSGSGAGKWQYDATAAFGAKGNDYADGPWTLTVTKVPYTTYDVVLYMATDNGNKTWGAVRIGSGEAATYYVPGTEDASTAVSDGVTEASTWGQTTPGTHGYGTDVIRIRNLTAETLELATLKPNDNTRAGLYGFQIVNTGEIRENAVTFDATAQGAATVKLSELGEIAEGVDTVEVRLANGATLEVDGAPTLNTLRVVSEGSVTVSASEASLKNVLLVKMDDVAGTATLDYANATATPTLPLLSGVEALRKSGTKAWTPTANTLFGGRQFIAAGGEITLDLDLNATVATAEAPMTVTGPGSLLRLKGNQSYNRAPKKATLLAEKGATLALAGVNPFPNGEEAPRLRIEASTLRVECSGGSHIKVADVTLANGARVEIAGTEGAYESEAFLVNTPGKLRVESGASTVAYAEGATENKLLIGTGTIEVAQGASLALDVALGHDIVKQGAGELTIPAARMRAAEVAAGTLAITGLSGDFAHALSGEGTVRLAATGDTALKGTVASTLSLAFEGAHTFALGASRPSIASLAEGAKLVLEATTAEIVAGRIELPRAEGIALSTAVVTVSNVPEVTVGEDGAILLPSAKPKWTAGVDGNTWSNAERWSNLGGGGIPTAGEVLVDFGPGTEAVTLTVDAEVALGALTISGTAAGTIALGEGGALAIAQKLALATDLALPASALPPTVEVAEEKALTLTGGHEALNVTFSGGGNLRFANGTFKLAGCDFSGVADLTIGAGATVDYNGLTKPHAVVLDGGTLANTASGTATIGAVTLKTDSAVDCSGTLTLGNNGTRADLALNNHTLTKRGGGELKIAGVDLDKGEIHVVSGQLGLSNDGGDSKLTDVTLTFDVGASYKAYAWLYAEGLLTVNCAGEVDLGTSAGKYLRAPSGKTLNLKKGGTGTAKIPQRASAHHNGTTEVVAGTLVFSPPDAVTKPGTLTVAEGATLKLQGSKALTFEKAEVKGRVEVADTASLALQSLQVAEGAAATLIGTGVSIAKLLEGGGSLTLGDGSTETRVTVGAEDKDGQPKALASMTVKPNATVVFDSAQKTVHDDTAVTVEADGVLELKSGYIFAKVSGEGETKVTGSFFYGYGSVVNDHLLTTKRVTVAENATFGIRAWRSGATLSVSQLRVDGAINQNGGSYTPSLSVGSGATLSGKGTVQLAMAFAEGATLDASAGAPTVAGAVALPENGTVVVKAPEAGYGTVLKASNVDAAKFVLETPQARQTLVSTGAALLLVQTPEGLDAAAGAAIAQTAANAGVTDVTAVKAVSAADASVARDVAAAGLFDGVVTVAADGTATVAYDFGIASLALREMEGKSYLVLAAKVQGTATAGYAEGTTIAVEQNGAPIEAEEMETDPEGATPAAGVKWFRIPYAQDATAPLRLKVKATTKATTP